MSGEASSEAAPNGGGLTERALARVERAGNLVGRCVIGIRLGPGRPA